MAQTSRYLSAVIMLLFLLFCMPPVYAQEDVQLRLVAVDAAAFPTIRITLLTADSRSAPADLADLSLSENGTPITDLTFSHVPAGIDVVFVLDANVGFDEIDDDTGLTRREKAVESIRRFANQYMNPDGLDTVSIVVPDEDGQSGGFLISDASSIVDIEDAINGYEPRSLAPTPLNAMLALALEQAQQRKDNGRYQAVLLFTDGRRLDQQLSFPQLVAQANDANVPIYSAILGESADPIEIDNVSRLNEPTRAFYVHLLDTNAVDPIYQIWQEQSNPVQLQYRSRQRQSGRNQLTLNLGPTLISSGFDVTLAAPEVKIALENSQILRAGTAPDTPLDALQPASQPVAVTVNWPDGLPRRLADVTLLIDRQPEIIFREWPEDIQEQIVLDWDITELGEGAVELIVQVADELGYQGISEPVVVDVVINRPLPPTPVPTAEPQEPVAQIATDSWLRWDLLAGIILILFLLLIALLWRRRKARSGHGPIEDEHGTGDDQDEHLTGEVVWVATLESLSTDQGQIFPVKDEHVAIGSQVENAQIVLEDATVSRLHARIRRQDDQYWLFDEGSSEGTYLNYERLGLAPRELSDGDVIQFGKAAFRFKLRQMVA